MDEKPIPAEKARQGRNGRRVFVILAVGLALAGAIWLGLEFWGEAIDTHSTEETGASTDQ